ncbi:2-C-methyl-D-erythritol 2,4-cyclodiphosphate synthase, chloroplastic [Andrographis paniculata]|uniref:2-C-methyl-D-erythritol 2,4-cyclodiphosphate synthase, chloroplastic n=1 Tax=Andrographis paniculata TaxID=175694 RepID=UPI0021E738DD|nr:2-C-methyl-D-erythritol 2,4-cyclodiphosphate synthase, chloroplastic [Andrographis paniculata]UYR28641.1 2-C-methyl-D-erythritol 2,4-cyclodiphosphate synthase [Andrographis alata]
MAAISTSSSSTLCYAAPLANSCVGKRASVQLIGPDVGGRALPRIKITARPSSLSSPPVVAAATSAVEAEPKTPTASSSKALPFRVGHGFDLHRLEPGYPLIIGGINIPHDRGCEAHSDGDVLLHCVVDAILGALGLPDIGQIFPDTDPKWKGAPSSVFIKEAVRLMHEAGYELGNLDATLILQRPKLSPHKETIRSNLCLLLGADPSVVNLKAKTHEKVDSLGENRSIAAHTVVLLMRK